MLVLPSSKMLTDKYLTPEETRIRLREGTDKLHDLYRLSDHDELKDQDRRAGQWMHSSELIRLVTRLNPLIWVEHQINFPDDWGLYTGLLDKKIFVCQFPKGWIREFTSIDVDDRNLPTGKTHGWRQVLLHLLGKGLLTWKQIQNSCGDSEGPNSDRWQQQTRWFRQDCASKQVLRNLENQSR